MAVSVPYEDELTSRLSASAGYRAPILGQCHRPLERAQEVFHAGMQCIHVLNVKALPYLVGAWFAGQHIMDDPGGLGESGIGPQTVRAKGGIAANDRRQALPNCPVSTIGKPFCEERFRIGPWPSTPAVSTDLIRVSSALRSAYIHINAGAAAWGIEPGLAHAGPIPGCLSDFHREMSHPPQQCR